MIIITKSDEKRHYVRCMFDFSKVLYEYLGQDAVDGFRKFLAEAYESGREDEARDRDEEDEDGD